MSGDASKLTDADIQEIVKSKAFQKIVDDKFSDIEKDVKSWTAENEYRKEKAKIDLAWLASSSQWIIASLLAVNSAGAIAVVQKISPGTGLWIPVALFVAGVIAALFAGLFYRQSARSSVERNKVRANGQASNGQNQGADQNQAVAGIRWKIGRLQWYVKEETNEQKLREHSKSFSTLSIAASWVSFAVFLSGIVICGFLFGQMYSRQLTQYTCQFDTNGMWHCTTEG